MPKPSVPLAFEDVIVGGAIVVETNDKRKVALRKTEPEPVCCLPAGSEYHVIGPGVGRPLVVNSISEKPGRNGKYEFFQIFPRIFVAFFPKHPHPKHGR